MKNTRCRGYTNRSYAFEEEEEDEEEQEEKEDDADENMLSDDLKEKLNPDQYKRVAKLLKEAKRQPSSEEEQKDSEKNLIKQANEVLFGVGVAAVSILRYLTEHLPKLTLSLRRRLLDTHDVPIMMVPLIENPPWTRRTKEGKWQKFINHRWQEVPPKDLLKLTPLEGQPWLTLYNILCDKDCRNNYEFHSYRRGTLMRTRKYMHQILVDQLPILTDLQRMFDEMSVSNAPAPFHGSDRQGNNNVSSMFVLQISPEVFEKAEKEALKAGETYGKEVAPDESLAERAEKAAEELGVSREPPVSKSGGEDEDDEAEQEPTQEDRELRYKWLCTAAACLRNGFQNKDVGDKSLMGIADLYASEAYEQVTGSLHERESEVEELLQSVSSGKGGSNDDSKKSKPTIEEL